VLSCVGNSFSGKELSLCYGVASIKFPGVEKESKQKKVMTKLYLESKQKKVEKVCGVYG